MADFKVEGMFQAGVMVSDVDECKRLFEDALGLEAAMETRNTIQRSKALSGVDNQIMNVLILRGEGGADLEIHQYVDPPAKPHPPLKHNDIGSMHFMLRVDNIAAVLAKVEELGYKPITEIVDRGRMKYAYFSGPDGMMVELHEGDYLPQGSKIFHDFAQGDYKSE
jgi:catechol 2,3-dioxygenase-like lactoylglutathione lyase family enzyme